MRLILTALLLLGSAASGAATPFVERWQQPQAFTLELQQQQIQLSDAWQLRSQNLQAELVHLHSAHLQLALQASRQFQQLQNGSSYDLDGYQAGLVLRSLSPLWQQLQLAASGGYHWQQGERGSNQWERHRWHAQLHGQWRPLPALGLYASLGAWQQQGSLNLGTAEIILPRGGYRYRQLGIDVTIEEGGHIGLELGQNSEQSVAVYFQRRY